MICSTCKGAGQEVYVCRTCDPQFNVWGWTLHTHSEIKSLSPFVATVFDPCLPEDYYSRKCKACDGSGVVPKEMEKGG